MKLSRGALVGDDVHGSGVMWKLPWPLQTAETYDVTTDPIAARSRARQVDTDDVQLWTDDLGKKFDKPLEPFIVSAAVGAAAQRFSIDAADAIVEDRHRGERAGADQRASLARRRGDRASVPDPGGRRSARLPRTSRPTSSRGAAGSRAARSALSARSPCARSARSSSDLTLDEVLGVADASSSPTCLRDRVQKAFDASRTGVELVAWTFPLLRPAGEAAAGFEELSLSHQARQQHVAAAEQTGRRRYRAARRRSRRRWTRSSAGIEACDVLRDGASDADAPETIAPQRWKSSEMLVRAGGLAAQTIVEARDATAG